MKRSGLLFLLLSTGIVIGTTSGVYYVWHQFTQLPEWYTQGQSNPRSYAQIQQSGAAVEKKIASKIQASPQSTIVNVAPNPVVAKPSGDREPVQVALNSQELNDLLVTKMTEKSGGQPLPNSIKEFHTSVKNDTMKTGAVVDVKELKTAGLAHSSRNC